MSKMSKPDHYGTHNRFYYLKRKKNLEKRKHQLQAIALGVPKGAQKIGNKLIHVCLHHFHPRNIIRTSNNEYVAKFNANSTIHFTKDAIDNNEYVSEDTIIKRTCGDKDEIVFIEQHNDMYYVFVKEKFMVTPTTTSTDSCKASSEDIFPDVYGDDK